jgi:glycosyltransferase involved in cell wall biosynthesis
MNSSPQFTVVIPVFNRPREIRRALDSCLVQRLRDFEVVVVDDASTDDTAGAVLGYTDKRITLMRHAVNRGPCAARNTGVSRAHGEWIVFLDSDDELLPGALETMARRASEVPASIHRLAFAYLHPGLVGAPCPDAAGVVLDYRGYLRWADCGPRPDFNNCIRRATFQSVRLPESQISELIYHLDFAREFRTLMLPDIVALIHDDAASRCSTGAPCLRYIRRQKSEATVVLKGVETILERHGEALLQDAPNTYRRLLRKRIECLLLAGQTTEGLRRGWSFIASYPGAADGWATLCAGALGRNTLAMLSFLNSRRRV